MGFLNLNDSYRIGLHNTVKYYQNIDIEDLNRQYNSIEEVMTVEPPSFDMDSTEENIRTITMSNTFETMDQTWWSVNLQATDSDYIHALILHNRMEILQDSAVLSVVGPDLTTVGPLVLSNDGRFGKAATGTGPVGVAYGGIGKAGHLEILNGDSVDMDPLNVNHFTLRLWYKKDLDSALYGGMYQYGADGNYSAISLYHYMPPSGSNNNFIGGFMRITNSLRWELYAQDSDIYFFEDGQYHEFVFSTRQDSAVPTLGHVWMHYDGKPINKTTYTIVPGAVFTNHHQVGGTYLNDPFTWELAGKLDEIQIFNNYTIYEPDQTYTVKNVPYSSFVP